MKRTVLLDTGPLVAFLSRRDRHHAWVTKQFARIRPPLLTCEAVLTEACFLLSHQPGGDQSVFSLLQKGVFKVGFSLQEEASAVAKLLLRYADVPMALADACLVRLAELNKGSLLLTLDSDFAIYRMNRRSQIPLLIPEDR